MDVTLTRLKQLRQLLFDRFTGINETEAEQAITIRLSVAIILVTYFVIFGPSNELSIDSVLRFETMMAITYLSIGLCIAAWLIHRPAPYFPRRLCAMLLDLSMLSLIMFNANDDNVFLFAMYLWVILGMGFRYGPQYLKLSAAIGLLGFFLAVQFGEYWQSEHLTAVGYMLLILMFIVPMYCAFLIEKLHAAIADAKFANQAKTRFLANMSHELRTPLNGVTGVADLLEETQLNPNQLELVDIMRNSSNTLLGLIENVLDISKIEAGKIEIKKQPFDLHQLITGIVHMQKAMARTKGIDLSYAIDSDINYAVLGDAQHLRQVLINLIGNAIKFTHEGGVKLLISNTSQSDEQQTILFEVQDSGIGIPEDAIHTIFDDFVQASSNNLTEGTGLGTTISKQLVELMGGRIGLESELGVGSRFWFELTFNIEHTERSHMANEKVLVLSTPTTQAVLSDSLTRWSMTHVHVDSSAQALAELMSTAETNHPYTMLLIEQSQMLDIAPVPYAKMIHDEPVLKNLSLVLLNHTRSAVSDPLLSENYISSVRDIHESRALFNALHAAMPLHHHHHNIVMLNEHKTATPKGLHILVAEDNLVNQKIIAGLLSNMGHTTEIVADGEAALEKLNDSTNVYDVMLLDMNLPEYSGIEILKAYQFMVETPIPSFILTADATPEARQTALDAGATVFMTKPIDTHKLSAELNKYIDTKAQVEVLEAATEEQHDAKHDALLDERLINELKHLVSGEPDFFAQLVEGFEHDTLKHLKVIETAYKDDYLALRESLHALKGSATEIGALLLAALCREGETFQPEQINSEELRLHIEHIQAAAESSLTALKAQQ